MENRKNKLQGRYGLKKWEYVMSGMVSGAVTAAGAIAAAGAVTTAGAMAEGCLILQCVMVFAAVWLLLIMAITDIKYMIIPDRWVLALGVATLVSMILMEVFPEAAAEQGEAAYAGMGIEKAGVAERVVGLFIVSAPMALINLVAGGCFGGGDIKLTAVCGFLLGWRGLVSVMIVVLLASGIFAAGFMALQRIKKKNRKQYFAFGPFICAGVILNIVFPLFRYGTN